MDWAQLGVCPHNLPEETGEGPAELDGFGWCRCKDGIVEAAPRVVIYQPWASSYLGDQAEGAESQASEMLHAAPWEDDDVAEACLFGEFLTNEGGALYGRLVASVG